MTIDPDGNLNSVSTFTIDGVKPTIEDVTSTTTGKYTEGDQINVQINFSEPVTLDDGSNLTVLFESSDAGTDQSINIPASEISETQAVIYTYTVVSTDSKILEGFHIKTLTPSPGSLRDTNGDDDVCLLYTSPSPRDS